MDNQQTVFAEKTVFVFLPMILVIAAYPYLEASDIIDRFISMILFSIIGVWLLSGLFLHNSNLVFDKVKRAKWTYLLALTIISTASCYVMFNLLTKSLYGIRQNFVVESFMNFEWFQTITLFLFLNMAMYILSSQIFLFCSRYLPRKKEQEKSEVRKKIHWSKDVKRILEERGTIYDTADRELMSYIVLELKDISDNHLLQNYQIYFSPKHIPSQDISEKLCNVILKDMQDNYGWDIKVSDFSFFFKKNILIHTLDSLLRLFFQRFKASFELGNSEPMHPRSFLLFLYYIDYLNSVTGNNDGNEIVGLYFSAKSGKIPAKLQNSNSSKNTLYFLCMFTYFAYEHYLREHSYANENITSFTNQIRYIFAYMSKHIIYQKYEFNKKYLTDPSADLDLYEQINFEEIRQHSVKIKNTSLNFLKQLNLRRNIFDPKENDEGDFNTIVVELSNIINTSLGVN